jgi:hypothetical protein
VVNDAEIFYLVQLSFGQGSEERVIDLDMAIRCRCLSCIDPPSNGLRFVPHHSQHKVERFRTGGQAQRVQLDHARKGKAALLMSWGKYWRIAGGSRRGQDDA